MSAAPPTTTTTSAEPLAASEYPISLDDWLPHTSNIADDPAFQSAIRHNSIHRWSLATRTIAHYCRLEQIGEGTYGQVYRAKCLTPLCIDANISNGGSGGLQIAPTGTMVALKKIRLQHSGHMGIPPTVLREIKILKKLQHKAMVKMYEVVSSKGVEALDWEEEREDEKRKKEELRKQQDGNSSLLATNMCAKNNDDVNLTPMPYITSDDPLSDGMLKAAAGTIFDSSNNSESKKKKKDPMSTIDKLRESYKGSLFLSLEYISHDLTGLLDMAFKFTEVQVKSVVQQLLEVLEFMHERKYVHRDLKSSNILITDRFEVKLAVSTGALFWFCWHQLLINTFLSLMYFFITGLWIGTMLGGGFRGEDGHGGWKGERVSLHDELL